MDLNILKIASNTDNHKVLSKHTHFSKNKNPICGDEMQIGIIVKKNKIVDFGYQCKSCIYCQASVSLLSRSVIEVKLDDIKDLLAKSEFFFSDNHQKVPNQWKNLKNIMNKKNISRKDCLLLPFKTLSKALSS
tara:strand:+ start:71 stop:469 length:399 start_codon:yes stop_codon:yes gene_type:complete